MASLILTRAGKRLLRVHLGEGTLSLGRDEGNHLVISSPDVSRRHAELRRQGRDYVYQDLGSANGSYFGGQRIRNRTLRDGDEITLGDHSLIFLAGDGAEGVPAAGGEADEQSLRDQTVVFDLSAQDLHDVIFGPAEAEPPAEGVLETMPGLRRGGPPARGQRARRDRLQALFEISQTVEAAEDLPAVLRAILDKALAVMEAERGFLMLIDPESGELRVHVARDRQGDITGLDRERVSRSLMQRVRETGKPVLVLDAQAGEWSTRSVQIHSIHSALCAPLKSRDTVTGVLYVDSQSRSGVFSHDDVAFFTTFALQASAVIQSSRAYWELVDSLFEASDDFVAVCGTDGRLRQVNRAGVRLLGLAGAAADGRYFAELVPPAERERARQLCAEAIGEGVASGRELSLVPAEGRPVPMSVAGFRLSDRAGRSTGLCVIGRDLSAQKFLVRQLERRTEFIQKTFGRYLSDEVVESILDAPGGTQLGGEKRKVTILMSDLRGFTQLSERLSPEGVVSMLNHYLGTMTELLQGHHGTIDEFIGDAILAIFGAPVGRPDDAERACACAVAMQLGMAAVNQRNARDGFPPIEMGIGLNTGEVVVGNIGSAKRAKYGVVGSAVNTTGRIESYTIGGQILISEDCRREAGPNLKLGRKLTVRAKGNKQPLEVHELLGVGGDFNLFLPEPVETFVSLENALSVRYTVLEGKHVGSSSREASLITLTSRGVVLQCSGPIEVLDNIKMEFCAEDGSPVPGDAYGKVTDTYPHEPNLYGVRLTSLPPAAEEFLARLRRAGEAPG